jgi:hypothetical protein
MTTLTLPTAVGASSLRAVKTFAVNFLAGVHEGRVIRDRYDRLSRLSDTELKRHGLDRQRIPQAAVRGIDIS